MPLIRFSLVEKASQKSGTEGPVFLRKRKAPKHLEVGCAEGHHSVSVQEYYRQLYFEAPDLVIAGITDRFDQPGYVIYKTDCLSKLPIICLMMSARVK